MKSKLFFCNSFRSTVTLRLFCAGMLLICAAGNISASNDDVQNIQDSKQLVKQAEKQYRKGNLDEAESLYRRAVAQDATNSGTKLKLAYLLLKKRNINEAYEISYNVAQKEPKNARAFAVFGMALLNVGNFKDAAVIFQNAYLLNKNDPLAWFGAGMLDFYENRIFESLPKLEQAVYLDNDNPDYIFSLAQVYSRAERYREASDAYERFLQTAAISDAERRDRIKGLISFLRYLGGKSDLYIFNEGSGQTTVPMTLVNQRPIIEIRVNDKKEKLRFVLDTGSGISVISDKTSERMKIKPVAKGGMARAIGGDGKFNIVYGFLKSLEIGDVKIRNVPVYIRKFHDEGNNIDGYIGLALISKFLTTVDYGNLTFSLLKEKNDVRLPENGGEALALPLRLTSSGFLSGEVSIEGFESPYNFIVDTGASVSVISYGLASKDEISRHMSKDKIRVVGAAGITENASMFLLPKVSFGSHSREKIQAVALDLNTINEAAGFEQAGILGGNFLKNYCLTFDFKNSKVTFVPNKK